MKLELTNDEWETLYTNLRFILEMLDEDDERYLPTESVLDKLGDG